MAPLTVAFHTDQIDVRGTCVSLYDYAHHNETLLGNKSVVVTSTEHMHRNDMIAVDKFRKRFPVFFYTGREHLEEILVGEKCDVLYCIKYGTNDGFVSNKVKTVVHAVFDLSQPHGEVFAVVSKNLADKYNYPLHVPHMISHKPSATGENLREELGISITDIVIGRYGGQDTFNLEFVRQSIKNIVRTRSDIYFLFINTPVFDTHKQVIFMDKIVTEDEKNKFICTCDAHLEASTLGHTFGLAMGEFSVNNKPIIAYNGKMWNTNHLDILKDKGIYFKNAEEFEEVIKNFKPIVGKDLNCYKDFSPEIVMEKFQKVFLTQN